RRRNSRCRGPCHRRRDKLVSAAGDRHGSHSGRRRHGDLAPPHRPSSYVGARHDGPPPSGACGVDVGSRRRPWRTAVLGAQTRDRAGAAAFAWARSGLMALTGPVDGAPLIPAFDAVAGIEPLLVSRDDLHPLTERAALMGLTRGGAMSCNRSARMIEA